MPRPLKSAEEIDPAESDEQKREVGEYRPRELRSRRADHAATPLTTTRMPSAETIVTGVSGAMNSPSVTTSTT